MGRLINGEWVVADVATSDKKGAFARPSRSFLDTIAKDHPRFQPESGRYHLYVSYACPWAQRTLIYRALKGLEEHISFDVVHPDMLDKGWSFSTDFDGAGGDSLFGLKYLHQLYQKAQADISTTVTVPVLWDRKTSQIVNNESSQIIRIFNSEFNDLTGNTEDFYPQELRDEIEALNQRIYPNVNNGVYRCGFAKAQQPYDEAASALFDTLEYLEGKLEGRKYLLGDKLTEADLRLIPTLLRFDIVYYTHFKCNLKMIADYPNLARYSKELYEIEGIKKTTNFEHIKRHYYYSQKSVNPYQVVPIGPQSFLPIA